MEASEVKITFQFDNGTSRIFLDPETAREERYIELVRENKPTVEIGSIGSKPKSLMLEFHESKQLKQVGNTKLDPKIISHHQANCGFRSGLICDCDLADRKEK